MAYTQFSAGPPSGQELAREAIGQESASSDSEDEDEEEVAPAKWIYRLGESVYDEGMLKLCRPGRKSNRCHGLHPTLISFLLVNIILQYFVVTKVHRLVVLTKEEMEDKLFGPPLGPCGGVCFQHKNDLFPEFLPKVGKQNTHKLEGDSAGHVWDCGPLLPALFSNVTWLDVDRDQYWSVGDVAAAVDYTKTFNKEYDLSSTFRRFMFKIKGGSFNYLTDNALSPKQILAQTDNHTRIPMTWMHAEQASLTLCNIVNPDLCGSLEARDILKTYIADPNGPDRARKCRKIVRQCDDLFGEIYHGFTLTSEAMCGEMTPTWSTEDKLTINRYEMAEHYDPRDILAVTRDTYFVFLGLVLVIWTLAVTAELRQCWLAAVVTMMLPSSVDLAKSDTMETIVTWARVESKVLIFVLVLIPRTCVAIALAWVGIMFLMESASYQDLILNSVALGFISEIDEMMYAAFVGQAGREDLLDAGTIVAEFKIHPVCALPPALPLMTGVFAFVAFLVRSSVVADTGKFAFSVAFSCLCHAEGRACLAAQVLGGLPHVPGFD